MLSQADHQRIATSIDAVERNTAGDIYCIVAHEASKYREIPIAWGALVALLVPPLALAAGVSPLVYLHLLGGWQVAQAASRGRELMLVFSVNALVQSILFAATALLTSIPAVTRSVAPNFLKRHRALQLAKQHFLSTALHLAPGQPHILIFLALAERRVEILANEVIHRVTGPQVWDDASAAIASSMRTGDPTSGIVRAIEIAGAPLIQHFPATRAEQAQALAEI